MSSGEVKSRDSDVKRSKKIKKKKAAVMLEENHEIEENNELGGMPMLEEDDAEASEQEGIIGGSSVMKKKRALKGSGEQGSDEDKLVDGGDDENKNSEEVADGVEHAIPPEDPQSEITDKKAMKMKKMKERLMREAARAENRGICYLSRIPSRMDHVKLRQILSHYGEIKRIYLAPEDPTTQIKRKSRGGFRGQAFLEGWVEFAKKTVAKRVAKELNGEQIGGRKRSPWFYDLWNIKYLSKFKWDDLTEEIAIKRAMREQKLALEISAAKRERDFYLSKVDQAKALTAIEERQQKKQKKEQESGESSEVPVKPVASKFIRQFPQNRPITDGARETKSQLSREFYAEILASSQSSRIDL